MIVRIKVLAIIQFVIVKKILLDKIVVKLQKIFKHKQYYQEEKYIFIIFKQITQKILF